LLSFHVNNTYHICFEGLGYYEVTACSPDRDDTICDKISLSIDIDLDIRECDLFPRREAQALDSTQKHPNAARKNTNDTSIHRLSNTE